LDESPPLLLGQVLPARERIEDQSLPSGVVETAEVFPAATGGVLLSPVEPGPDDDLVQPGG
jgi:hypothetical protein